MAEKQQKYNFGILETPGTSDLTGNSCNSARSGFTSSQQPTSLWASLSKSDAAPNNYSRLTSAGSYASSSDGGKSAKYQLGVAGVSSSTSCESSLSVLATPSTCRTPRRPAGSTSRTSGSRRTPASASISGTPTALVNNSSTLVAIVEGRGIAKGEVGMASLDLKKPELILSQFSDMPTYVKTFTKLQILQPLEIILPNTSCESGSMTSLSKLITDQFTNVTISAVQRKYFNESKGLLTVKQLCVPEYNSVVLEISTKYYCLAATASLIKYIEFIQNTVYAPSSLKIVFKGSENTTMIDVSTSRNLELLQNQRDSQSFHSLFGILNHTKTAGGTRLLRSNILQPPSDHETISLRHEVVAELTEKSEIFYALQATISRFLDVDHLLSLCVQVPKQENVKTAEIKITNMMYLKHTLELVEPLRDALADCENPLLKAAYKMLEDPRFSLMLNKIHCVIHDDCRYQKGALNMRAQKCFAVKSTINGVLDIARKTYTEIIDDISDLVAQMAGTHNLPLKVVYNSSRGYHIQLYMRPEDGYTTDNLPGMFIKLTKYKNTLSFTTADLLRMNDRVKESEHEIYIMTSIVLTELLNGIRDDIGCLYKLTETVSMLDMLLAFAHVCTLSDYVRPEFTDTMAIHQGRHPILEKISVEAPVPNDVYASEEGNFMVITGPNMSGKSTYLRQIALLQIMAQIGSFVPAEYASFRIVNQIFSRIGSDDDLETNSSTFTMEMQEVNYIIQTVSPNSLVIIDELGRGTSVEEGVGLCYAVCEYLIYSKAFTFFVTHFAELTSLDVMYPNVENFHFETKRQFSAEANSEKVLYTHVLSKGKTKETHYGIQLAEISTLARAVIEDAKSMAAKLAEQKQRSQKGTREQRSKRAMFKLATRLVQTARSSRLEGDCLQQFVSNLKNKYEQELLSLEE